MKNGIQKAIIISFIALAIPFFSYAVTNKLGELVAESYPVSKIIEISDTSEKLEVFLDVQYGNICYQSSSGISCVKL